MNAQVTVTLPEEVLHEAELFARRSGRAVEEFLAEAIELTLRPLSNPGETGRLLSEWSDEEVLNSVTAELTPADDERVTELLHRQQAGLLNSAEQVELTGLMRLYSQGLLLKAQALHESVRRKLGGPLQP